MQTGAGTIAVVAAGIIVGVGGYHVYKGASRNFLADLEGNSSDLVRRLGVVGYIAKGLVIAGVGAQESLPTASTASPWPDTQKCKWRWRTQLAPYPMPRPSRGGTVGGGAAAAMKSSRISTTAAGDSTCGKCPTPLSTSSRLPGRAS
jgi:hypothetical protein